MNGIVSAHSLLQSATATSTSKVSSVTTDSTTESDGGLSSTANSGVSTKYDTLELSQDYLAYKMQDESSTVENDANQLNSTSTVTETEESSSTDLSSYSESELKSMVSEGTITRGEYVAEIASRQVEDEEAAAIAGEVPPPIPPEKPTSGVSDDEISSGDSTLIEA